MFEVQKTQTHEKKNLSSGIIVSDLCVEMFDLDVLDPQAAENQLVFGYFLHHQLHLPAFFGHISHSNHIIEFPLFNVWALLANHLFTAAQSYFSCSTSSGRTCWPSAGTPVSLLSRSTLLLCFEKEMTLGNNSDRLSPIGPSSWFTFHPVVRSPRCSIGSQIVATVDVITSTTGWSKSSAILWKNLAALIKMIYSGYG